jgi:hypothetical protein
MSQGQNTAAALTAITTALQVASKASAGQTVTVSDLMPIAQAVLPVAAGVATGNPAAGLAMQVGMSLLESLNSPDPAAQQAATVKSLQALAQLFDQALAAEAAQAVPAA